MPRLIVLESSPLPHLAASLFLACLACLPAAARAADGCSAAGFKVGQTPPTGGPTYQTISADFNADGSSDLASTSGDGAGEGGSRREPRPAVVVTVQGAGLAGLALFLAARFGP